MRAAAARGKRVAHRSQRRSHRSRTANADSDGGPISRDEVWIAHEETIDCHALSMASSRLSWFKNGRDGLSNPLTSDLTSNACTSRLQLRIHDRRRRTRLGLGVGGVTVAAGAAAAAAAGGTAAGAAGPRQTAAVRRPDYRASVAR